MQPANALNPFARTIGNLAESREFTSGLGKLFGGTNMNNVIPQSTFTGGITPSEFSNYQSLGVFS
jgi:hypothetical protein